MTDKHRELVTMFENADASRKELIFNMVACAVAFGEFFWKEIQELSDKGDKDGMIVALEKWTALLNEQRASKEK